jgi:hypothetical protein
MNPSKPRVIKDYDKLDPEIKERIKLQYPNGYSENLIYFTNKDGKRVSALPFETEDRYYLIRMTVFEAEKIIEDDDFDSNSSLKENIKEEYESKYGDDDDIIAGTDDVEEIDDVPDDSFGDEKYDEEEESEVADN